MRLRTHLTSPGLTDSPRDKRRKSKNGFDQTVRVFPRQSIGRTKSRSGSGLYVEFLSS